MAKPKLAFFSFACCEGCQLQVLNLEDELLDILGAVEIVNFREAIDDRREDYDIAFIEGSITRPEDEEELKHIRERAKVLVALGACSATGGVNALKNFHDLEETKKYVYGDKADQISTYATRPADAVVPVEYKLHGCPVSKSEILELVKCVLMGKPFRVPNYPVCVECKLKENVCLYDQGIICLGVISRAGCGALCPSYGSKCIGCRGLIDNPNTDAAKDVLAEHGLTVEDVLKKFRMFYGCEEVAK